MDTVKWVQILDKTDCISHSTNTLVLYPARAEEFGKYDYTHFWTKYEPSYPPRLNSVIAVILQVWLWHLKTLNGYYAIDQRNLTKLIPQLCWSKHQQFNFLVTLYLIRTKLFTVLYDIYLITTLTHSSNDVVHFKR